MRYIKQPARSNSDNCQFEIVEDTPSKKLYCFCRNEKDAKIVLRSINSAERKRELRKQKRENSHQKN